MRTLIREKKMRFFDVEETRVVTDNKHIEEQINI